MQAPIPFTKVTALIDWNSQIYASRPRHGCDPLELCRHTLAFVGATITKILSKIEPSTRFEVSLRLYHGWFKGFTSTTRKRAMLKTVSGTDFTALSGRPNVIIRHEVSFGDELIYANPNRLHYHLGCHLPNTLRNDPSSNSEMEKMVDTAIASDLVALALAEPKRWLIVLGEDDDLVPPIFVAEGVRGRGDGKVILVRKRPDSQFLKLDNLKISP